MVVEGGMGVVTQQLAAAAVQAGAAIRTNSKVEAIETRDGAVAGKGAGG
jgi:phytoene dehydrogenase-like protein